MSRETSSGTQLAAKKRALLAQLLKERGVQIPGGDAIVRQPDRRQMPLSFGQQRLWFLDRLEPESPRYIVFSAFRLQGTLQVGALTRSLGEILHRHQSLRVRFVEMDGQPELRLVPAEPFKLRMLDLGELSPAEQASETQRLALADGRRPFSLVKGPLLRATLLRLGDAEHVLLISMHHVASDGWSMGVLTRELWALYEAFRAGHPSPVSDLPVQYADFAAWQRGWLQGAELEEQLSYWRRKLEGLGELELPTDHPRPAVQGFVGAWRFRTLTPGMMDRVRMLSRREGVTPFMTLLAAFSALLGRYVGGDDIPVGSPIANRSRAELEGLIGFFANTLVLRTDLSGNPTFRELLVRVREVALGGYAHQDLPFEKLVEELRPERDLSRSPLFQVAFVLQNDLPAEVRLPGLTVTPTGTDNLVSKFDLTLYVHDSEPGLIALEYSTDLFEAATIDRMALHLETLLRSALEDPDRRLSELPLLTAGERQQALVEWNGTGREYPREASIHELFAVQAVRRPEAIAVSFENEVMTYRELDRRSNQLANHLRLLGVGPEVRVGICVERSFDLPVALLGILKAGGAYVPLDPSYPKERLAFMLEDSRVPVLVTQERMLEALPEHGARLVRLDRDSEEIAAESEINPASGVSGENLAYVIYTSGSTGIPKGVEVRQRGVLRLVFGVDYAEFGPEQTFLQLAPVSFDASTLEVWGALLHGGKCVLYPERVPTARELGEVIEREGVTTLWLTASLYNAVVDEWPEALRELKQLLIGGEALSVRHVRRGLELLPGTRIINGYGPTESTTFTCCHSIPRELPEEVVSIPIGRPIGNTRTYVLDKGMSPLPIGVSGELFIGGDGLARGYLNRPDLTAERFVPDPFSAGGGRLYRTGDLVRWRGDGTIEFVGRRDQQVKVRGYRIELGEIEAVLGQHPAVKDAVVVVREDTPGDKRLVGYVVGGVGASELRRYLKGKLPEYMVPSALVELEALPLSPNGKVDRGALPAPGRLEAGEAYEGARTPAEEVLARIWSEVLRVEAVGIRDDFFELGGDSILSLQVIARANDAGLRLSVKQLFQHQTVAELAAVAGTAVEVEAEQGLVLGEVPLTPVQRWFFEQEPEEAHHFNQAVLLDVRREVAADVVEGAVRELESHHDALRMRFEKGALEWDQRCVGSGVEVPFRRVDLRGREETEQRKAIEAIAEQTQRSLDLRRGPVWRVVLFELGEGRGARLLVVIHHLVVDGVSWRVLLADLQAACGQLTRGERVRLPAKTSSFKQWSERLLEYVKDGGADGELGYWRGVVARESDRLPVNHEGGQEGNTVGSTRTVSVVLGEGETRALLQEVPAAYRTQIGDVLLTAVLEAFRGWTGRDELLIELEGHGREELFEGVDLSRTVGWFTTMYPVRLERVSGDLGEALKGVKEQLRQVPNRGIGYGLLKYLRREGLGSQAEVAFNYLGQFDQVLGEDGSFAGAGESTGRERSERGRRTHLIEVGGLVAGGRLRVDWGYSEAVHERETVEALARRFEGTLLALIEHCRSGAWGYTPSDFPLAKLEPASLEHVVGCRREVEDIYPLSPMQEGMLFHTVVSPASGVYFEQGKLELEGVHDSSALRRAWERVVERHGALRTHFVWEGLERPLQVVQREVSLPWEEEDWRDLGRGEQEERFEQLVKEDRDRGFELGRAPLMRLKLVRLGEEKHRLVWSFHHVILDGWSMPLLWTEVLGLYRSYTEGVGVELGEVRPYREYIAWLGRQDPGPAEGYWREELRGFTAPTPLGVDRPSRGEPGTAAEVGERIFAFGEEATSTLKSLGRRHGLTLNTLVQGAWAVLLSRYSGERDVLFGVTVSGRPASLRGVETMVGLFINTLPLRVEARDEQPLLEWLKDLQARQVEQRPHEHTPLVEIQKWSEAESARALFESLLVFENYPVDPSLGNLGREPRVKNLGFLERTNYPLTLVAAAEPRLYLRLIYDRGRFDDEAIVRLAGHLTRILEGLASNTEGKLGDLPLLTEQEVQLLADWNATGRDYPREAGIHELLEVQAAGRPDSIAVSFGGEELSYGELNARGNRLAHHLRRHGVGPEVRVGICVERSVEMVVGWLGILKAGGAYVPLDPSYPKERLGFMLEDSRVPVLLTQERMLEVLPAHGASVVCLDRDWGEIAAESDANLARGAGGENLAYVMYTSGSTGRPKGVEVEHRGLASLVAWHRRAYGVGPEDRATLVASPAFDASTWEVWPYLVSGASLHVPDEETRLLPRRLLLWLREKRITHCFLPTPLAEAMLKEPGIEQLGLRYLLTGGDRLHRVDRDGLPFVLVNHYGPTENTVVATCGDVELGALADPSIGRPIDNTRIYVLDRGLNLVPVGVPGELFIGGDGLARGYLNRPDLTAERFVPDPFSAGGGRLYRTGDLVRWRGDGTIEFLGRRDQQVKVRGYRIELGEIEAVLGQHPGVKDVVVLAREDTPGDKRLVGYVVGGPGASELRRYLKRKLPEYMVPSVLVELETLPLSPNGKVDRRALPAPEGRPHPDRTLVPPRNDLESKIAAIWREVLQLDEVGIHDNFFDLGGHSLRLLRVHGKLRESVMKADVKIVDLFQYPTVAALAAHLSGAEAVERREDVEAEAARLEAGHERLGRRRGIRNALADVGSPDA